MKNLIKQTAPIRPPPLDMRGYSTVSTRECDEDESLPRSRPPNMTYVYGLTCFVSLGGFLFGWNQSIMAMIIADARWLELMQPANDWGVGFVVSIYNIGCVIGALTIGFFADSCGRERTISLASSVFILGALLQAASYTIAQMISAKLTLFSLTVPRRVSVGRFVLGIGVGAYSAGVPSYISEIAPPQLRGRIVGILMMILCFAEMVVFFVDYAFFFLDSNDWWRLPLVIQVLPALVLAIGCWAWVPPSPRWLVAQERYECALEVLTRLHGSAAAEEEIRVIRETVEGEANVIDSPGTSWADMFRGPVLRVTLLGTGIQMFQQTTGTNGIFYYAPELFKKGGITDPKLANLATGGIGVVLFLSAWIPVLYFDRFGRKTWFQVGLIGMVIALTGICVFQQHAADYPHSPVNNAIVVFPYLFFTFFNLSWSAGSWTYASEIFPLSLRAKGNALCTASLWISNFVVAQISPPIESATGYGLYILFIVICVMAFVFVRFTLVETKGRSLEEMAELFGIERTDIKGEEERSAARQALLRTTPGDDDLVDS
ncbi:general substrate transporter [Xylaria arbuscula]|nr:general substrate transporter [Xylaria arbuscula]